MNEEEKATLYVTAVQKALRKTLLTMLGWILIPAAAIGAIVLLAITPDPETFMIVGGALMGGFLIFFLATRRGK